MVVVILLSVLCLSFSVHLFYLIRYIRFRHEVYLSRFIDTTVINVVVSGVCIVIAIFMPEEIRKIEVNVLMWGISGFLMSIMFMLQIMIFIRVYRRSQMPQHYHYNFFGKKVLHGTVATPVEVALFFGSIPFLLGSGAYFVARLVRLFI
ncbi:MAG TPA: hypothetical protein PK307_15345 [Spirochaetota bacterium]|mgnify:CR=1 FL=1|nr:hypothetical protein [Spirochaetota bacterium]HOD15547.1 hypothetical protein [Spirochaetota bacterium]HPG49234.1 hypothetical protein [Spirochaetota bacterium]HQL83576.1 hypothetical protein [Spirochaetota bacterium]